MNKLFLALLLFLGVAFHSDLYANENIATKSIEYYLDDVTVTAERRESNIQETPAAITTYTAEDIDEFGITEVPDLSLRTPGLTIGNNANASFPEIYIRGVGTVDFSTGADLSVGFYIDDVYIGRSGSLFTDLFDLERIEVLKGPQGTLWGRNSIAGTLHFITRKPSHDFETRHKITYGNYDLFRLAGTASGPIKDDMLYGRFSYNVHDRAGYAKNSFDGNNIGDAENISARGSLEFLPTDNSNLILNIDYSKHRPTSAAIDTTVVSPVLDGNVGNITINDAPFNHVEPTGSFDINQDAKTKENRDIYGISANLENRGENYIFKSISAYRGFNFNLLDGTDGVSLKLLDFIQSVDQQQFSQEFRLSNKTSDLVDWVVGTYFFREQSKDQVTLDLQDFDRVLGAGDYSSTNFAKTVSYSYSLFGQTTFKFTNRLSATVGARYTYEEKDFETRRVSDDSSGTLSPSFPLTRFDEDWQAFTPKVGVQFQKTNDLMYYGSVSRGFRSGGFNSLQNKLQNSFEPEFLTAYELGFKSRWFDRRLYFNVAAFYYKHTDLQVLTVISGPQVVTTNAAEARNFGLEIEVNALLFEGLSVDGGLSFLNARYEEFTNASGIDVSDNTINNTPDMSSNLAVRYTFPLKDYGYLTIGGEHQYQSEMFFTETNESVLAQKGYHYINTKVQFETYDRKFIFSVFGNNLTDEEAANSGVDLRSDLGTVNKFLNPPRTFGIEFTYNY